jgi:3D (Asp-Asp-Asp) domain-containing protein
MGIPRTRLAGRGRAAAASVSFLLILVVMLVLSGTQDALAAAASAPLSGGAGLSPLSPPAHATASNSPLPATPPAPGPHSHGAWLAGVTITEYWPVPESWFAGQLVSAPGLPGKHRIDWLYSAEGISMQGEGIGFDGRLYHLASAGSGGWITAAGKPTDPARGWAGGTPFWRAGGFWRTASGAVTFPLAAGGWSAGPGTHYVPLPGVSFAPGPSLPLRPYQSIAVDPRVIPLGSLVYIPAYRDDGHGGWFVAQDTGGAIVGHRIDVYRTPPPTAASAGQYLVSQRVYVVKPGA